MKRLYSQIIPVSTNILNGSLNHETKGTEGYKFKFIFSIQMCSDGSAVIKGTCCFALERSTLWLFKRMYIKCSLYISFNSISVSIKGTCCFALECSTLWLFKLICMKYSLYISFNSLSVSINISEYRCLFALFSYINILRIIIRAALHWNVVPCGFSRESA